MFWRSDRLHYDELSVVDHDDDNIKYNNPQNRTGKNWIFAGLKAIVLAILISGSFFTGSFYGQHGSQNEVKSETVPPMPVIESQYGWTNGFETEFGPATSVIESQKVKFDNDLRWNGTNLYMEKDPDRPTYVGEPNRAIDAEWDTLLNKRWFAMNPEEAKIWEDQMKPVLNGKIYTGFDMFHALHCLDMLRRTLDPEFYTEEVYPGATPYDEKVHLYHCVDHIRQTIQCGGDLTPLNLAMYPFSGGVGLILGNPTVHTCRNANAFRRWLDGREDVL